MKCRDSLFIIRIIQFEIVCKNGTHVVLGILSIQSSFQAQMKETESNACSIHQIICHIHINDFFLCATGNLYLLNYLKRMVIESLMDWPLLFFLRRNGLIYCHLCDETDRKDFVWHFSTNNRPK